MPREIHAGDVLDRLKAQGYDVDEVAQRADGSFDISAPRETEERRSAAIAAAALVTVADLPMSYEEALARVALGTADAETRAIVSAEVSRLAAERA